MEMYDTEYGRSVQTILKEIDVALHAVDPGTVDALIEEIAHADQVFLIGVGRVMLSLMAFAKRLNHLGIKAHCVGDISEPAMTDRDLLIVASGSGKSLVPVAIAGKAHALGAQIAYIGSNMEDGLSSFADLRIRIPVRTKLNLPGEIESAQIMTSLFEQSVYLLCDACALMMVKRNQTDLSSLWRYHANLE